MGWTSYIAFALKCAHEVFGKDLACGPDRRQAILAVLVLGGLLPFITRLESWKDLSEFRTAFAFANSGLALVSIGFLLFAHILLWRTPRHEEADGSDPAK